MINTAIAEGSINHLLILCVPHAAYKHLDLRGKPLVDIWNPARSGESRVGA
jgi:hypothetical protein